MPVDFNLLQPLKGPGPEIASIGNLLSSFAEQRMRQQQQQQAAEQAQRQFEAQQANIAADNARADAQLEQQKQAHKDALAAQAAKEQDAAQKEAYKAVPGVKNALLAGDEPGARVAAGAGGITLDVDQQQAQAAQEAQQTRGQQMADSLSPFAPMLGGAMPVAAASAKAAAPTDAEKSPRYLMGLPGSKVPLPYSPEEERQAQRAQREKQSGELGGALEGASPSKYAAQAVREAQGLMRTGQLKESPADWVAKRTQHLEDQANSDRRAAQSARKISDTASRGEQRIVQAGRRGLEKDIGDFAKENGIQELSKAYGEAGKALTLSKSASGPAQVAAVDAFIKSARGGTVTGASFNATSSHLGGLLANLESRAQAAKDGGYGAEVMSNLAQGLSEVRQAIKDEVEPKRSSFVDKYYGTGEFDEMKGNVDNAYTGLFGPFGYKTDRHAGTQGVTPTGKTFKTSAPAKASGGAAMPSAEDFVKKHGF